MECGEFRTIAEIIAQSLVKDDEGNVYLNAQIVQSECQSAFVDCDNSHLPVDELLLNVFTEDDCDNQTVKIVIPPIVLNDLSDVDAAPVNGATLVYDATDQTWKTRIDWDDLRITPGSFDRPGISDPAYVPYYPSGGGLGVYVPEFGVDDFVSFAVQLPHGYAEGEDIYVHLHWTPGARGVAENGKSVGWKLDYTWANYNDNFPAMQTVDLADVCDGVNHKHQMAGDVLISGAGKRISSMILCNLRRTDTGIDDTWATNTAGNLPILLEVDFHIPYSTRGSTTHSSK